MHCNAPCRDSATFQSSAEALIETMPRTSWSWIINLISLSDWRKNYSSQFYSRGFDWASQCRYSLKSTWRGEMPVLAGYKEDMSTIVWQCFKNQAAMKTTILLASAFLGYSVSAQTVGAWGQCGGINYSGSTTCVSGYVCTYENPYYSQCVPG